MNLQCCFYHQDMTKPGRTSAEEGTLNSHLTMISSESGYSFTIFLR
jgi:hypothetical protein